MTDLLGLGAQGVRGYTRALQTIGDNIANAQTPGYARRSTVLAEQVASGQSIFYRNQVAPGGMRATGVTRAVDPWLIEDARAASADAGRTSARLAGLEAAETALADGGAGVGRAMTAFFNRADELAADPANATRRGSFIASVDTLATTFRRTTDGLARAAAGTAFAANAQTTSINDDVTALQSVNDGLRRARDGSSNQATLLDERDRLIDAINTAIPVDVTVEANGAVSLSTSGVALLAGRDRSSLDLTTAADGRLTIAVTGTGGPISVRPGGGALAGAIDAADHIAGQRAQLDALAIGFSSGLNAQHAAGRDAAGNPGGPLFAIGSGAGDLTAIAIGTAAVAAGDATSSNGNALAFGALRGDSGGEAAWSNLAAQQSQAVASAQAQNSAASIRREGADAARGDLSGVDLDREAAELVRFQQAYQASARVIQAARETMQTILDAI